MRAFAKAYKRFRKSTVGMHRNMTRDVVEDIRFRQVIQFVGWPYGNGRWKFAIAQTIKEQKRWNVPADSLRLKTRQRAKKPIHVGKLGNPFGIKAKRVDTL